jgi:excisionase family DNA binding protein
MATARTETVAATRRPISIRRAAEILGVNQATLRQWSDAGKIHAFTTPGGHRRFFEDDLLSLTRARSANTSAPALAEILLGSRERYEALVRRCLAESHWFQSFDDLARRRFRILGSSMLSLIGTYLTSGRRERERTLGESREVATEYGAEAARLGLSLSEATEAFVLFRTPVLEGLNRWLREHELKRREAETLIGRANHFMDQVLLSMASSHDAYRASHPARPAQ